MTGASRAAIAMIYVTLNDKLFVNTTKQTQHGTKSRHLTTGSYIT